MTPDAMAEAIINEARRWVGTPYKHRGRHLHKAVDCIGLVFGVMETVGLGDRHCDNMLFDDRTGDCCHVDFGCLGLCRGA